MTRQKSLKYISKLKQIAIDFVMGNKTKRSDSKTTRVSNVPETAKDEIAEVFSYKQGKHKLKRKKPAKRTKLKK